MNEKSREQRIRRALRREGLGIHKGRGYFVGASVGYMVYDLSTNLVVAGVDFDWSLEDLENYLKEPCE